MKVAVTGSLRQELGCQDSEDRGAGEQTPLKMRGPQDCQDSTWQVCEGQWGLRGPVIP